MILDNIHLIAECGQHYFIDNDTKNMLFISRRAFDILTALKEKQPVSKIKNRFGDTVVERVLKQLDEMREKKFLALTQNNLAEKASLFIEQIPEKMTSVVEGVFMITQSCNMSCRYCYGGEGEFGAAGFMNAEMAEEYLRIFLTLGMKNKIQKVKFLGGEPLLNFELMKYMIGLWEKWKPQYEDKELYFSFTTNGTLFTPEIVEYIKEKNVGVTISLDGPQPVHDENRIGPGNKSAFDLIMRGMELLRQLDVAFTVRATVSGKASLDEIFQFFKAENYQMVHLIPADFPMSNPSRTYQWEYDSYKGFVEKEMDICKRGCLDILNNREDTFEAKQMKIHYRDMKIRQGDFPFKCGAGWWMMAFSTDGYIYPCHRLVGNEHFRIGNHTAGVDSHRVTEIYRRLLNVSEQCYSCCALIHCGGRCLAQKVDDDGRYTQVDPALCNTYIEKMQKTLPLVYQLQKKMDTINKKEVAYENR